MWLRRYQFGIKEAHENERFPMVANLQPVLISFHKTRFLPDQCCFQSFDRQKCLIRKAGCSLSGSRAYVQNVIKRSRDVLEDRVSTEESTGHDNN